MRDPLPLLVAMCGLPRSGKSTISRKLSQELGAPIVNQDSIRLALHGQVYASSAEPMVKAMARIFVESLFRAGHDVVILDETNYSRTKRDSIKSTLWRTEFLCVPTDAKECKKRAIATDQPWLLDVIDEMVAREEPLGEDEHHSPDCYCHMCISSKVC